jgi:hypothetical protein
MVDVSSSVGEGYCANSDNNDGDDSGNKDRCMAVVVDNGTW